MHKKFASSNAMITDFFCQERFRESARGSGECVPDCSAFSSPSLTDYKKITDGGRGVVEAIRHRHCIREGRQILDRNVLGKGRLSEAVGFDHARPTRALIAKSRSVALTVI